MEAAQSAAPAAPSSAASAPAAVSENVGAVNAASNGPAKGDAKITARSASDVVGKEGTPQSWAESLSPEHKEYVTQKGFKDPLSVLESYRNLEKLRGVPEDRLLKLPESAEADGWQAVYSKLGKPETPEGYEINVAKGEDASFANWAKEAFHKLNLSKAQAKGLLEKFADFSTNQEMQSTATYTETIKKQEMDLRKDWGAAYHQNVANAQRAYRAFGLPDNAIKALEREMGFDGVMKLMNDIGSNVGEHGFVGGGRQSSFGEGEVLTPDAAKAKIASLKRDGDFTKKYQTGDITARNLMSRLHQMAYPTD